jgi:RNA polymerase sigma factor (sigma-70 family)
VAQTSAENIGHLLRELAPQVLAAMARRHADFAEAEDAVQEALIAAALQWPKQGVPNNPRGWLYQVAVRRLTDHVRSETARRRREDTMASQLATDVTLAPPLEWEMGEQHDDTLVLLFMCCHPALTSATAIALTLRAVGGLTTAEIASAFLVPEATMAQRISRAKQTIKSSNVAFSMPTATERSDRLSAVLHVLYLIFNEGYASSNGTQLQRADLSHEAIRLTRMMRSMLPADPEVAGLLALMLLTDARRLARSGPSGELIPLDEQDRSLWDQPAIMEGIALIAEAMTQDAVGPYQLQAAIAALHDEAASAEQTDWPQILALYSVWKHMSDNPMVALNHAIAAAMVNGPQAGLQLIDVLEKDERIAGHYRLDAVRAHLFERAGDAQRAMTHYRKAAERTTSTPERHYLISKAARLACPPVQ